MNAAGRPALRTFAAAAPFAVAAAVAAVSWNRWITPFVDGSREMSIPARVAAGERLYRDVVCHYGPVAPWLGGALMKIVGTRWSVLEVLGAAVTALLLAALSGAVRHAGSRRAALAAAVPAAALCVGAPLGGAFLYPYSFDFLIAVAAGLSAIALATAPSGGRISAAAAVVCLGTAIGARPEVGLPTAALLLVAAWRWRSVERGEASFGAVAAGGTAVGALLWGVAIAGVPLRDLAPEGPGAVFSPPAEWRRVYAFIAGLDDPAAGLSRVATALFLLVIVVGAAWLLRRAPGLWLVAVGAAVSLELFELGRVADARWPSILAPFPLLAFGLAAAEIFRPGADHARARFLVYGFGAIVGSRVLLRLTYGQESTPYTSLALPAVLGTAAVFLVDALPHAIRRDPGAFRRNVSWIFAAIALAGFLRTIRLSAPSRTLRVETPKGSLRLPPAQAGPTQGALAYLAAHARPGDRLAGFPEAGIFNVALGLPNPLREEQILPGHLNAVDERRVVARLEAARPRFVVLVGQPSRAFGEVAFGEDYARELWAAVQRLYRPRAVFGTTNLAPRIGESPFFVEVFELAEPPQPPPRV